MLTLRPAQSPDLKSTLVVSQRLLSQISQNPNFSKPFVGSRTTKNTRTSLTVRRTRLTLRQTPFTLRSISNIVAYPPTDIPPFDLILTPLPPTTAWFQHRRHQQQPDAPSALRNPTSHTVLKPKFLRSQSQILTLENLSLQNFQILYHITKLSLPHHHIWHYNNALCHILTTWTESKV